MSLLSGNSPRKKRGASRTLPQAVSGPWRAAYAFFGRPGFYRRGDLTAGGVNVYFPDAARLTPATSRPSITRMGTIQLGSGSNRNGQCVFNHTRADGTEDRLLFAGGKMYTWNGSKSAPSVTDITPAATTISTTARIFCCTFNDKIIVSDGVNTPWSYEPATATRAFIDIDGSATAWVARGAPFVHAAKLFFIVASLSATTYTSRFIWSEEADETIGYVQTGGGTTYTNKWDISQSSPDPLTAAIATNNGIFYFRAGSIGFITGQVNASFATTATHDAVSATVGTVSPASVLLVDGDVWFSDQQARQWRLRGGSLDEMWRARLGIEFDPAALSMADIESLYYPELRLVLTDNRPTAGPSATRGVWDVATGGYFGAWSFPFTARAMGVLRDADGVPCVIAIGSSDDAGGLGQEGYVYRFRIVASTGGSDVATTFDDSLWSADDPNSYRSVAAVLGDDLEQDQRFTRVIAEVWNHPGLTSTSFYLATHVDADVAAVSTSTSGGYVFGSDRVTWGTNLFGRVLYARIECRDLTNVTVKFARVLADRMDAGYHPDSA